MYSNFKYSCRCRIYQIGRKEVVSLSSQQKWAKAILDVERASNISSIDSLFEPQRRRGVPSNLCRWWIRTGLEKREIMPTLGDCSVVIKAIGDIIMQKYGIRKEFQLFGILRNSFRVSSRNEHKEPQT